MSGSSYYSDLIRNIRKVQEMEIPGNLLRKKPVRTGAEFDPNTYLEILSHLSLKAGYILDFAYAYHEGLGGHPCLYARPADDAPFDSMTQHQAWEQKHTVSDYLVADGTPESFFELVVFREVANQFYLYWHAAYNDLRIITEVEEVAKIVTTLNEMGPVKFDPAETDAARVLNPEPQIELTETSASVIYCTFTQWGGFTLQQEVFSKVHPHLLLCSDVLQTAKYNCGIVF
jgi:hypothetical protein